MCKWQTNIFMYMNQSVFAFTCFLLVFLLKALTGLL